MENFNSLLIFIVGLVLALSVLFILQAYFEKRKRVQVKDRFREFTSHQNSVTNEARAVPRVSVPEDLPISISIQTELQELLKGNIIDISLSGFAVCPSFPLKKLALKTRVGPVEIDTPDKAITVKTAEVIRIEHKLNKRLLAFKIRDIENQQFNTLKQFIISLDKFTTYETEEHYNS